jgi:hypothetical protein
VILPYCGAVIIVPHENSPEYGKMTAVNAVFAILFPSNEKSWQEERLMKKTKLTRLIAAFLSLMMLVTAFGVTTAAADASSSQVSYDIAEVQDLLNAETYAEYAVRDADVPRGSKSVTISGVSLEPQP